MTKEAIIEKLKPIVQPFVKNEEAFKNLSDTTDFITDLNINSANLVDIVLDIEEAFHIEIDNELYSNQISYYLSSLSQSPLLKGLWLK